MRKRKHLAALAAAVIIFSGIFSGLSGKGSAQVRDFAEDENVVVVLDPGHGSWNPGACNSKYKLRERVLNLKVSKYTKEYLEQYKGVEVYLTRYSNKEDYSLRQRAQIAASYNADILISQHFDGSTNKSQSGAHVIVSRSEYIKEYYEGCRRLGELICRRLHAATGIKIRYPATKGVRTRKTEQGRKYIFEDGTVRLADYYGIIQNSIRLGFPAIIIEHGTITNNGDAAKIRKEATLRALGKADAQAIAEYFHLEKRKNSDSELSIQYRSAMQEIGWQGYKGAGETAGTMQFDTQMEALEVALVNEPDQAAISGSAFIGDGIGWVQEANTSELTLGSPGSRCGIQAFQLELSNCPEKCLQYRAYIQESGWTGWKSQGELCGVPDSDFAIEAVQLRFPDSQVAVLAGEKPNTLMCKTHGEKALWSDWKQGGKALKVTKKADYIDSVRLVLVNATENAALQVRGYYHGKWNTDSTGTEVKVGREGGTYPLEALQLSLFNVPDQVIEYRVYIKNLGWTAWGSQGDVVGIPGHGYSLSRVQIRLRQAGEASHMKPSVSYRLKDSKGYGSWMETSKAVRAAGQKAAEKLDVSLYNCPAEMRLKARAYVEGTGWKDYTSKTGSLSIGKNKKKLKAFSLSLSGMDSYKLQYKAYIKGEGWTKWMSDGAYAGTGGKKSDTYITRVMIRLVAVEQPQSEEATTEQPPETEASTTEQSTETEAGTTEQQTETEASTTEQQTEAEASTTEQPPETEASTTEQSTETEASTTEQPSETEAVTT